MRSDMSHASRFEKIIIILATLLTHGIGNVGCVKMWEITVLFFQGQSTKKITLTFHCPLTTVSFREYLSYQNINSALQTVSSYESHTVFVKVLSRAAGSRNAAGPSTCQDNLRKRVFWNAFPSTTSTNSSLQSGYHLVPQSYYCTSHHPGQTYSHL